MNKEYNISERLSVRPVTLEDTDNIVKWRNSPGVKNNFLHRQEITPGEHIQWLNTKVATGEVIQFVLQEKLRGGDLRPIGSVYFRDIDYSEGTAEYGIFIGEPEALGKGYGTQTARWAVSYAGEALGLDRLMLRVLADNNTAIKSYEKAGFERYDIIKSYIEGRDLIFMQTDLGKQVRV